MIYTAVVLLALICLVCAVLMSIRKKGFAIGLVAMVLCILIGLGIYWSISDTGDSGYAPESGGPTATVGRQD